MRRFSALADTLGDEGLRLFFPLAALHAAIWPALWAIGQGFDLVFTRTTSPFVWHGYELLIGAYGAALIGFITTAVPEWTGTPRPQGGLLFGLALLWGIGRLVGLGGADRFGVVAALADLGWLAALVGFVALVSLRRRTDRLLGFLLWLSALAAAAAMVRWGMICADMALAERGVLMVALAFLGLLGLALARIGPPILNQILDPTEASFPFRPHPGRLNLAPGLVAVAVIGQGVGGAEPVFAYLLMAAGAAFLDRTGETFVGREFFRAEVLALAGSSLLAGAGLMAWGASLLWATTTPLFGLHLAVMGGLGLGVLAVFSIAGLLHTGRPLGLRRKTRFALLLILLALGVRVLPEFGLGGLNAYRWAALLWAASFLLWFWDYWPWLKSAPGGPDHASACGGVSFSRSTARAAICPTRASTDIGRK
ncbi:NnrS family protein [Elstera cyanobacteriorum]|uniref:NnrS family protein n=1 Tax=Elstera cyanobacteriorum TaxID=2022747 RepID=A0A255XQN1_9PROT|nr:hypothetical protein CHR90_07470 [Elstera cyanobacteriorum]GFZ90221.1 hypothetical protein GCM10011497_19770 [Elstera cyanobacteriorum]